MSRRIEDAKVSVGCERKCFQFHIHDFANLSSTRGDFVTSPEFTCKGHQWQLRVFPGGGYEVAEGHVSAFLNHLSQETVMVEFGIDLVDKFGKTKSVKNPIKHKFTAGSVPWGWPNFISRSDILAESRNILDGNGTLTIDVSIAIEEEPTTAFVPKNPLVNMMQEMFNDETTADVCFDVSNADERKGEFKSSVSFYAHRLILQKCAPMLAAICGPNNDSGGVVTAQVNDIEPEIFQHLLSYVYGRTIPEEELKTHAKDIIDAADKYSIINLKLEAEAAYVKSTEITFDNAMDHLLYADSMNLALLKEAAMYFLSENPYEAAERLSFTDCPQHVVKDLLIAFGRSSKKDAGTEVDELTTLSVSALRRKLDEMGLEVDGSREAMIESIKRGS